MQIEKYRKRTEQRVADSTMKGRLSALRNLESHMGEDKEPTVEDVEDWIDHLIEKNKQGEVSSRTIREYLKAVKYYFNVVKGENGTLEHITSFLPERNVDHGEYLEVEEWDAVERNTLALVDRVMIKIMYYYARRPGEVRLLNVEDIELPDPEDEEDRGSIKFYILKKQDNDLPYLHTSNDRYRVFRATFEIVDEVERDLREYLHLHDAPKEELKLDDGVDEEVFEATPLFTTSQGRISYSGLRSRFRNIMESAGIEKNVTPKGLRHSRATHLDWDGENPEIIARQQLLHSPESSSIGNYIHERGEDEVRGVMGSGDDGE